jgi:signal transduction histidine kinase
MMDCLCVFDDKRRIVFMNNAAKALLGVDSNKLISGHLVEIVQFKDASGKIIPYEEWPIFNPLKDGKTFGSDRDFFVNLDDNTIPIEYTSVALSNRKGIAGCFIIFRNIIERKEAEEQINRYIEDLQISNDAIEDGAHELSMLNARITESEEQLRELNASKDKFFSIISHDLKNPFTALVGLAEIIATDIDTLTQEELQKFATHIHRSAKGLYSLLENLLQWSRIQTGRIKFTPESCVLNEIIEDVSNLLEINAVNKHIELKRDLESGILVMIDKEMIQTVLRNLISNAIKFTNDGGTVTVATRRKDDYIEVSVRDNGVGMPEEDIEKLFRIDVHHSTVGTGKEKGTGLGLILCKEFVEKHGGDITVESKPGEGSLFRFTLLMDN